jgi:hypothetical protein
MLGVGRCAVSEDRYRDQDGSGEPPCHAHRHSADAHNNIAV